MLSEMIRSQWDHHASMHGTNYQLQSLLASCREVSRQCRCGSIKCPACGMVKFIRRVNRISVRVHKAKAIT